MALLPGVQGDDVQAVFVGVQQVFQVVLDALEFGASHPDFWHDLLARHAVACGSSALPWPGAWGGKRRMQ